MANPFLQAARSGPTRKQGARGFWASPAGKHKSFATKCFALAKRYKSSGNKRMALQMSKNGRYALALSRQEVNLWNKAKKLRRSSIAQHRSYA